MLWLGAEKVQTEKRGLQMITIDEAAQKWSCSKNTVLSYVYKRYITGMCVDGETLLLPDIKKPYIPRKRFDGSFGLL